MLRASIWLRFDLISAKKRRKAARTGENEGWENDPPVQLFTSIVFDGEIVVVGDFWSEAEREVLPVAHLVFVHRRNGFNDLEPPPKKNMSTIRNGDVESPPDDVRADGDARTYLPGHGRLTHEHLVVGGELRGVVVHVFDPDVDTDFGVLVMAAYTQVDKKQTKKPPVRCSSRF